MSAPPRLKRWMTHNFCLSDQESLELLERLRLPHDPLGRVDLPSETSWEPRDLLRWGNLLPVQLNILHKRDISALDDVVDGLCVSTRQPDREIDDSRSGPSDTECQGELSSQRCNELIPFAF